MTDYTIVSSYRNKKLVQLLVSKLNEKGKSCYNFAEVAAHPEQPDAEPEVQMKAYEKVKNFYNHPHFQYLFKKDLEGLKNAQRVILLLPAGTSAHMEAGIAFGLGKPLILIGEAAKPESLYLMFVTRFKTIDDFLNSL